MGTHLYLVELFTGWVLTQTQFEGRCYGKQTTVI